MTDLDDILEAVIDIEDIVEEIADPEDLVEDFLDNPLVVALGLVAGFAAILAVFLVLLTVVFLVLAVGLVEAIAALAVFSLLLMALALGGFLYVRTDISSNVQGKIDAALERADDTPQDSGEMTEKEAVEELKAQYAEGNLDDRELEAALEEALTSDRPETVVEQYE